MVPSSLQTGMIQVWEDIRLAILIAEESTELLHQNPGIKFQQVMYQQLKVQSQHYSVLTQLHVSEDGMPWLQWEIKQSLLYKNYGPHQMTEVVRKPCGCWL